MLKLKEAIIVEGRYDKIKLSSIINAPIIETSGFRIFKDKEKQNLIREIARTRGILVFTDSDGAGFVIRSFLRGAVNPQLIKHAYIPMIHGKEKRKQQPSKEGLLGVEGISDNDIIDAIRKSGATIIGETAQVTSNDITKQDLYEFGLSGRDNSAKLRTRLLNELNMPTYITANAMLTMLNCLLTKSELEALICNIKEKDHL